MKLPKPEEAKRLREAGTPGEWTVEVGQPGGEVDICSDESPSRMGDISWITSDYDLIAAAVNAFVPMSERIAELEAAFRESEKHFGNHGLEIAAVHLRATLRKLGL